MRFSKYLFHFFYDNPQGYLSSFRRKIRRNKVECSNCKTDETHKMILVRINVFESGGENSFLYNLPFTSINEVLIPEHVYFQNEDKDAVSYKGFGILYKIWTPEIILQTTNFITWCIILKRWNFEIGEHSSFSNYSRNCILIQPKHTKFSVGYQETGYSAGL